MAGEPIGSTASRQGATMTLMDASPVTLTDAELAVRLHSILEGIDLDDLAHLRASAQLSSATSFLSVGPSIERVFDPSVDVAGDTRRLLDDLEALPAEARDAASVAAVLTRVRFAADRLGVR
jgi:hypothetical protein